LNQQLRIVALDIGPGVNLAALKKRCIDGEHDGGWYFAEGDVTPARLSV